MRTVLLLALAVQDAAVTKLLRQGDEAYGKRDQEGMPAKAIEAYKKAIALDESRVDAYWKIALVQFWNGTHEKDPEKQQAAFKDGIEYAKIAVSLDGNCKPARFWLALLYGLYGQARGIAQSLHMLEPMKAELDWILEKDEAFEDAGAHRAYGRLYFLLPAIKGGDKAKARKHLARAIELAPKNLLNYLYVAEIQSSEGRRDEAKASLKSLLDQPDDPRWKPECAEWRAQATAMLKELEK
jgi:tetratricopeptide (TPR) repeat protein